MSWRCAQGSRKASDALQPVRRVGDGPVRQRHRAAAPSPPGTTACVPAAKRRMKSRTSSSTELPKSGSAMQSDHQQPRQQQVRQEADGERGHLLALLGQRVGEVDDPGELGDLGGLEAESPGGGASAARRRPPSRRPGPGPSPGARCSAAASDTPAARAAGTPPGRQRPWPPAPPRRRAAAARGSRSRCPCFSAAVTALAE